MKEGRKEMFYLTTHSTHFIYGYMASDIWLRTILIVRKETRCRHMGYSFRLTARVLLYAPSHRQDSTYHSLCYTSRGALAGTRNSSMGPPHEGSIRRPIAPWATSRSTKWMPSLTVMVLIIWITFIIPICYLQFNNNIRCHAICIYIMYKIQETLYVIMKWFPDNCFNILRRCNIIVISWYLCFYVILYDVY